MCLCLYLYLYYYCILFFFFFLIPLSDSLLSDLFLSELDSDASSADTIPWLPRRPWDERIKGHWIIEAWICITAICRMFLGPTWDSQGFEMGLSL